MPFDFDEHKEPESGGCPICDGSLLVSEAVPYLKLVAPYAAVRYTVRKCIVCYPEGSDCRMCAGFGRTTIIAIPLCTLFDIGDFPISRIPRGCPNGCGQDS